MLLPDLSELSASFLQVSYSSLLLLWPHGAATLNPRKKNRSSG